MARKKPQARNTPAAMKQPKKSPGTETLAGKRLTNAERSAYFSRREAAKVLRTILQGDDRRQAVGSIKSLVYGPSVRNKRATYALVCQTIKHLSIIKDILGASNVLNSKWKRREELIYIVTYDILFGQEDSLAGDAEKFLLLRKDALQLALAQLLVRRGVKKVNELITPYKSDAQKPRYVRVNTLKMDVESALLELRKQYVVQKDDMIPELLVCPPGTDLHDHPFVQTGSILLQGKASSMVAASLGPKPGWEVIDACAAPGNKTVHLAALMKGQGKVIACELDKERFKRLKNTVKLAGAANVQVMHEDFLNLNPEDPSYSKVRAILLDPSCSGSGTAFDRLDHLLPSANAGAHDGFDMDRLQKLANFQKRVLEHALRFPAVERIVYSTCSIHQIENEDVINSLLPLATSHGFQLEKVFPQWPRRGFPVMVGSENLLRTDLVKDKEGFFIALFSREGKDRSVKSMRMERNASLRNRLRARRHLNLFFLKMFRTMWYAT
nr:probable 28S rRNA (cytosine-C(5))-methyltransferase [Ipomoea batatas]